MRPNVGKDYSIAVVNREAVRSISLPIATTLLLASIAVFVFRRRHHETLRDSFFLTPLALALSLLLDGVLPERVALAFPIESLQRIVPGLTYTPFNLIALAGLMALSYLGLVGLRTNYAPYFLFAAIIVSRLPVLGDGNTSILIPPYSTTISNRIATVAYSMPPSERSKFVSPSLYVLQHFNYLFRTGEDTKQSVNPRDWSTLSKLLDTKFISKIETLPPTSMKQVAAMIDGDVATRWTPGGGVQRGGESIRLSFTFPVSFEGIRINTGRFVTDFPRGLKVAIPSECGTGSTANSEWIFPNWRGSLRFTSDNEPYFSPQSEVTVAFGMPVAASCIIVEQTSSDDNYDWSVAEIDLLVRSKS